jgi:ribosome-binding protein aMBF1 (putative translation factor)
VRAAYRVEKLYNRAVSRVEIDRIAGRCKVSRNINPAGASPPRPQRQGAQHGHRRTLQRVRKAKDLSQRELAKRVGVTNSTISLIEQNKSARR